MGVEPSPFRWTVDPATGIVVDGDAVLNPEGFRRADECVRHKILDAVMGPGHHRTMEATRAVAELYERWQAAEPGGGHDVRARQWHRLLEG